jgi:type IV pilus biogenesis protein CpaD/CtpE
MPRTHGELFGEIGELVFSAHHGHKIDLTAASKDLALRYADLNLTADAIARAIARSAGAVGISLTLVAQAISDLAPRDDTAPIDLPAIAGLASGSRAVMVS